MKIAILSPHRDDAAFSLSLAITGWLAFGHSVEIVSCFTRSEYAPYSDADSLHPNDRLSYVTALRLREDESWRRMLGAGLTMTNLNLKDAPLRLRCSADEVCTLKVNPTEKGVIKIRKALEGSRPDALILPLAVGNHIDHLSARTAGVLEGVGLPCAFYEDLPYATRPGGLEQIEESIKSLGMKLEPILLGEAVDEESAVQLKRKAALFYDSQIDSDVAEQIAGFSLRYGGCEQLWANADWRASRLMTRRENSR